MPANTNYVYQAHSVPKIIDCGVGRGVGYPVTSKSVSRPNQYKPATPAYSSRTPTSHDKQGNSTYSK